MRYASHFPIGPETSGFVSIKAGIVEDIRHLVESARSRVASYANSELTLLYWQIGERIRRELFKNKRAEYDRAILPTLSAKLEPQYGDGFSERNLARMGKLVECFPDRQSIRVLSQQLSWSHFVEILSVKNSLAREFYAEMCRVERWSVRVLREKIGSLLFQRTALSRKPDTLIRVSVEKETKLQLPIHTIGSIACFGRVSISSLLKNPIFVILSEAKDRISVGDSSAFGLRMTQLGLFQQTVR